MTDSISTLGLSIFRLLKFAPRWIFSLVAKRIYSSKVLPLLERLLGRAHLSYIIFTMKCLTRIWLLFLHTSFIASYRKGRQSLLLAIKFIRFLAWVKFRESFIPCN